MAVRDPAPPGSRQRQREDGRWVLVVPAEYWVSEAETCRLLRVGPLRLRNATSANRVMRVENPQGQPGSPVNRRTRGRVESAGATLATRLPRPLGLAME